MRYAHLSPDVRRDPAASVTLIDLADLPAQLHALAARVKELEAKLTSHSTEALLDVEGAAKLLGMSEVAVRSAAYRGTLPCVRVGSRLRFRPSDLLRR